MQIIFNFLLRYCKITKTDTAPSVESGSHIVDVGRITDVTLRDEEWKIVTLPETGKEIVRKLGKAVHV